MFSNIENTFGYFIKYGKDSFYCFWRKDWFGYLDWFYIPKFDTRPNTISKEDMKLVLSQNLYCEFWI